jgi:predicted MPP superfamily phosphohydrolase
MSRMTIFAIVSTTISIYFLIHYYVFFRLYSLLGIKRNIWVYVVIFAFSVSFILASFLERQFANVIVGALYAVSASWIGALFLLFSSLVVYEIIRLFVKVNPKISGIVIVSVVFLLTCFSILNALTIKVKEVSIPIDGLENQLSIVQLTDMHIGTIHNSRFVKRVVDTTNSLAPDLVVITGDLIDSGGRVAENGLKGLKDLKAKTFFVTGNHEIYSGIDDVAKLLDGTGVKMLRDEVIEFKGLQIVGVNDGGEGRRVQKKVHLETIGIDKSKPSILLKHRPNDLEEARKAGIDLQLSGHTHAGQLFPFNLIAKLIFPKTNGLYTIEGMYLYVSPGTGTWGPPMRLGSRNEITLIRLTSD